MEMFQSCRITGKKHLAEGLLCQDCTAASGSPFPCIALADGCGDDDFAAYGAQICANVSCFLLSSHYTELLQMNDRLRRFHMMTNITTSLYDAAARHHVPVSRMQSTLLALAVDPRYQTFLCFHLGDGLAAGITGKDDAPVILSGPENGPDRRLTRTTAAPHAEQYLRITAGSCVSCNSFFLTSDGWREHCRSPQAILHAAFRALRADRESGMLTFTDDVSCILMTIRPPV